MKRNYYIVTLIMLTSLSFLLLQMLSGRLYRISLKDLNLALPWLHLLPFAFFIAYGVMSIPSGMLIEKYNEKKVMVAAFIVAFFGSLLLAFFPNYLSAILSLFLIGCGLAMLQVVINPLLRTVGRRRTLCF